ncbi:MAG: hypothetical protein HY482_02480 [Candidatus Wildermuthbacteria bacterium]|nr:hypothetical protein [Candidatus Wildermuthbacteria bacterium]
MEIIPKIPQKHSLVSSVLFFVSIAGFAAALGGFWLFFFLEARGQGDVERLTAALGAGKTQEEIALEDSVGGLKKKLDDFTGVISSRKDFAPAFAFLENAVHPAVVFSSVSMGSESSRVQLRGTADSYVSLEEQLAVFKARPETRSVSLTDFQGGESSGVSFQVELEFPADFFQDTLERETP